jgi:hypothetical protein
MSVKRKRKLYDVAFKTKVVLEALKEQKTPVLLRLKRSVSKQVNSKS